MCKCVGHFCAVAPRRTVDLVRCVMGDCALLVCNSCARRDEPGYITHVFVTRTLVLFEMPFVLRYGSGNDDRVSDSLILSPRRLAQLDMLYFRGWYKLPVPVRVEAHEVAWLCPLGGLYAGPRGRRARELRPIGSLRGLLPI
jgi:hypothetical protein